MRPVHAMLARLNFQGVIDFCEAGIFFAARNPNALAFFVGDALQIFGHVFLADFTSTVFHFLLLVKFAPERANGWHYLRWGSDGETVRADNVTALIMFEIGTLSQRQVHALLGAL